MSELRETLRTVLSDRHSPEARSLFMVLLKYTDNRVNRVWRQRYRDLFSPEEIEELVGEVVCRLMAGALARFQGDSLPALYAFVRTIADRTVNEAAHRRIREQGAREKILIESRIDAPKIPTPTPKVEEVPLSEVDQAYLRALFQAGSKAALARNKGQSRAAVTRMIQRIRSRIDDLPPDGQQVVDAWMHQAAKQALSRPPTG